MQSSFVIAKTDQQQNKHFAFFMLETLFEDEGVQFSHEIFFVSRKSHER